MSKVNIYYNKRFSLTKDFVRNVIPRSYSACQHDTNLYVLRGQYSIIQIKIELHGVLPIRRIQSLTF